MKNKFPLLVAIIVGVVALFVVNSYVKNKEKELRERYDQGKKVVAAAADIPPDTEITMDLIEAKTFPVQFIPSQAITSTADTPLTDFVKLILGRRSRVAIKAGQPILWSDLASEARGGLSSVIRAGEGAYTVAISKGIKPSLLQPSDHIDIIGSFASPKPAQQLPSTATWRQGSDIVNVVLLQNVTVLAVGESFGPGARQENSASGDLTLSLTLPEAQLLMFAGQQGELGAILRREGATEVRPRAELPRVTFEAIENIIGDLDGKRHYRNVDIQRGAEVESIPVANPQTGK